MWTSQCRGLSFESKSQFTLTGAVDNVGQRVGLGSATCLTCLCVGVFFWTGCPQLADVLQEDPECRTAHSIPSLPHVDRLSSATSTDQDQPPSLQCRSVQVAQAQRPTRTRCNRNSGQPPMVQASREPLPRRQPPRRRRSRGRPAEDKRPGVVFLGRPSVRGSSMGYILIWAETGGMQAKRIHNDMFYCF